MASLGHPSLHVLPRLKYGGNNQYFKRESFLEHRSLRKSSISYKPMRHSKSRSSSLRFRIFSVQSDDGVSHFSEFINKSVFAPVVHFFNAINSYLPHIIIGSTILALFHPPSFTWFTTKYYAPALGFLMFAVGINLSISDFQRAFRVPSAIALGYICQFVIKPLLGFSLALSLVPILQLPEAIGSGLILCACVSGAQLSNYATFLVEPAMAPLSIVMTALSTLTAAFVTPLLTYLLLGQKLPVDFVSMMVSIAKIVIVPIATGLTLNKFATPISKSIKPFLPSMSVFTTALCIGSPLAVNVAIVKSNVGLKTLVPVAAMHLLAFIIGYWASMAVFPKDEPLARTISLETGMQSSLLGLALANQFFLDPLVGIPSAISVILMSLMGFGLVMHWKE